MSHADWGWPGSSAFAPDALTPLGGYPGSDDEGRALQQKRKSEEMTEDFMAAAELLQTHDALQRQGGRRRFLLRGRDGERAGRPHPGRHHGGRALLRTTAGSARMCSKIKASLLIHYAELDRRINAGWPAYEEALKAIKGELYGLHLPRCEPRLSQRHDSTLRRGGGQTRLAADDRFLQRDVAVILSIVWHELTSDAR